MGISRETFEGADFSAGFAYASGSLVPVSMMTIAAAAIGFAAGPSGEFYTNDGAVLNKMNDRLFIGGATLGNGQNTETQSDWLSTVMNTTSIGGWAMYYAQAAVLPVYGNVGMVAAGRSSDAYTYQDMFGAIPPAIGFAAWAINDDTHSGTSATAFYGEAWRMTGANSNVCFGIEIDGVNLGGALTSTITPYNENAGGGITCYRAASGGSQSSASSAGAGFDIVSNPSTFNVGINIGATAITGTDGADSGYGEAVGMGAQQAIAWHTPETVGGVPGENVGFFVRSTVQVATQGSRLEGQPNALVISDSYGHIGFQVSSLNGSSTAPNYINIQAGYGSSPGIYSDAGDILIAPASGQTDFGGNSFPGYAIVVSTSSATTRMFLNVSDSNTTWQNASGYTVFQIAGPNTATTQPNVITLGVGFSTTAASINVITGGGNSDLDLIPAVNGSVVVTTGTLKMPQYTVATLPSAATYKWASVIATDGRNNGEGASGGTGLMITSNGTSWIAPWSGIAVTS